MREMKTVCIPTHIHYLRPPDLTSRLPARELLGKDARRIANQDTVASIAKMLADPSLKQRAAQSPRASLSQIRRVFRRITAPCCWMIFQGGFTDDNRSDSSDLSPQQPTIRLDSTLPQESFRPDPLECLNSARGLRQHLFVECVRYHLPNCVLYLPPFKNLFDIQIEISGFIRWHADRVPSFGYFRGRNTRSRSIARMNPLSVSV